MTRLLHGRAKPAPERHVRVLSTEIGERNVFRPAALAAAADYIAGTWRDQGYSVAAQGYEVHGVQCANLEATLHGTTQTDQILIIGAHYDSVFGSPGANDNASGVAALLDIAGLLSSLKPAMTVRFVAFVNEEPPFFMTGQQGSAIYAKAARARGDDIRLMISLETIGCFRHTSGSQIYPPLFQWFYPDRGNFLAFVSNFRSRGIMRRFARNFRRHSDMPIEYAAMPSFIPGVSWSDHRSFWKRGYRAFMVTDTAFYRYPQYHTAEDTADKLSYPELSRVIEGLYLTLADIATNGVHSLS